MRMLPLWLPFSVLSASYCVQYCPQALSKFPMNRHFHPHHGPKCTGEFSVILTTSRADYAVKLAYLPRGIKAK